MESPEEIVEKSTAVEIYMFENPESNDSFEVRFFKGETVIGLLEAGAKDILKLVNYVVNNHLDISIYEGNVLVSEDNQIEYSQPRIFIPNTVQLFTNLYA